MAMKDEIEAALQAHAAWRKRFRDYLYGHAPFDTDAVSATDQCDFGRWLDREGYRLMPTDLLQRIRDAHGEFHRIAGEIVQKIRDKRFDEARADIAQEGAFNSASARLTGLLLKAGLREPAAQSQPAQHGEAAPAAAPAEPGAPPPPEDPPQA